MPAKTPPSTIVPNSHDIRLLTWGVDPDLAVEDYLFFHPPMPIIAWRIEQVGEDDDCYFTYPIGLESILGPYALLMPSGRVCSPEDAEYDNLNTFQAEVRQREATARARKLKAV